MRRAYIDWARGVAVLLMIEAHTFDAWTRGPDRGSVAFRNAIVLGGFAAPLFLWLSGLALVLSATAIERREKSRAAAVELTVRRGLETFVLAFLFRLQAFVVTPGSHPVTLFRVDILNIMGPSMAAAALVWGACRSPRVAAMTFAGIAMLFAMFAPIVRTAPVITVLPIWVQWYIRPAGEHTTFTAFPWAGFVFAGAAVGVLLANTAEWAERRVHVGLACAGVGLIVCGFFTASLPAIYRESSFWTSSPTYFAIRVGVLFLALVCLYGMERRVGAAGPVPALLGRLGRRSLLIYWIHVELVYGYAAWPLRLRLPLWGTLVAYFLFVASMYGVASLFDAVSPISLRRRVVEPA